MANELIEIRHEIRILDHTGDQKIIWDPNSKDEVDSARKTFNDLRGKGYLAFKAKKSGKRGKLMTQFDPEAEKMILTPPPRGG